jgi:membrane-associated protein
VPTGSERPGSVCAVKLPFAAQAADLVAINPFNAADLIATFGVIGVLAIIFAETGLLIGFFFPGDSLLFIGGIAASPFANLIFKGVQLNIWALLIGAPICAIAGAQLGHLLGARYGARLFDKPNSRIFKPVYVEKAEYYFNKFGPAKAVILARFIPIVRTFLNPVAGVLEMPARKFFVYNLIGGVLWADGVLLLGYFAARKITDYIPAEKIDNYLLPLIVVIVLISGIPIYIEVWRNRREHRRNAGTPAADTDPPSGRHHRS